MDLYKAKPFKENITVFSLSNSYVFMKVIAQGMPETNIFNPKTFKASLTGITALKEGKYRCRYQVANGYGITAKGELIIKPKEKKAADQKKFTQVAPKLGEKSARDKNYRIAKQIVKNRMRAMVNMLQSNYDRIKKPKLYFFTISFLEGTTDNICYQVLNTWLTHLKQKNLLLSYLWVAERQKNSTIHFHMAVPHYMNVQKVNRIMRIILLDQRNKGNLPDWDRQKLMKYNGVDIAKNRKTKRPVNFASREKGAALANYLTKYITKNDIEMNRLAWHCSRDWSALILGMTFTRAELGKFVTRAMIDINSLETEYCSFYRWEKYKPPEKFAEHLGQMNYKLLDFVIDRKTEYLYQLN